MHANFVAVSVSMLKPLLTMSLSGTKNLKHMYQMDSLTLLSIPDLHIVLNVKNSGLVRKVN